jgi:Secretion system C-terminal sorting domain
MKIFLLLLFSIGYFKSESQITSPVIRANFGVDGDLSANYYNSLLLPGNDDWFNMTANNGSGIAIIDTTGAASIIAGYAADPTLRQQSFLRTMSVPPYSIVNNHLEVDAVFVRDYHGDDSTVFASGASKNGMSPQNWSCPVSQSVPAKNDILDIMTHLRRSGPNLSDSLWMFGGISIENTTGNRYFDFEMYQTDIYYDRSTLQFYNYGPDAGHTSWKFDASGNILSSGDIIFSANYGSSTLSSIEARIWVDSASMAVTPVAFNWSGTFDGATAGSQFGYAGISPKSSGTFYTGTANNFSTWAGAFQLVRGDNSVVTNYIPAQFMEFGVNLSKLGLDPATRLGGNPCEKPFRRILIKSRASTSFTAQLKDFVAPFNFFEVPSVNVATNTTALCGLIGTTELKITDRVPTSTYTWSTPNGNILQNNGDSSVVVDAAGTYIVTQKLQAVCPIYATDTVVVTSNPQCFILQKALKSFTGKPIDNNTTLNWTVNSNNGIKYFQVERSVDAVNFTPVGTGNIYTNDAEVVNYTLQDYLSHLNNSLIYYRLKIVGVDGQVAFSNVISLSGHGNEGGTVTIIPNPVKDVLRLNIFSPADANLFISIYDLTGKLMKNMHSTVQQGNTELTLTNFQAWPRGIYSMKTLLGKNLFVNKMVLVK